MADVVVQAGFMSGDMFGTAAALKLKRELYVLVVHDNDDASNAKKMYDLYLSSVKDFSRDVNPVVGRDRPAGIVSARVKMIRVTNSQAFYKSMHDDKHTDRDANLAVVRRTFPGIFPGASIKAMGSTTGTVKYHFGRSAQNTRRALIQQWEIHDFDELGLQRFLHRKGVHLGKQHVFLWIRQSGKTGGAHPELDSSRAGWQQIINGLPNEILPVLSGDRFNKALVYAHGPLINLTQFWDEIPFCLYKHPKFVGAEARLSQFALFDYMNRAGYKVCHLGMRSGVLESVALMGGKVTYMEETGNPQQKRIEELAESMPNFDRLELSQLPTLRGQVIDRNQKTSWSAQHKAHIQSISSHCYEKYDAIAKRISALESEVKVGAPFATYLSKFIELSAPVWKPKYGDVSDWAAYKKKQGVWCNGLESRVRSLYDATYSKAGFTKGFAAVDLTKIIAQIRSMLT